MSFYLVCDLVKLMVQKKKVKLICYILNYHNHNVYESQYNISHVSDDKKN